MPLLQSGVPFNVIALWLGHESTTTTHRYVEADLALKEKALARLEAPDTKRGRYKAPDSLLRFLQTLQLSADHAGLNSWSLQGPVPAGPTRLCTVDACAQGSEAAPDMRVWSAATLPSPASAAACGTGEPR